MIFEYGENDPDSKLSIGAAVRWYQNRTDTIYIRLWYLLSTSVLQVARSADTGRQSFACMGKLSAPSTCRPGYFIFIIGLVLMKTVPTLVYIFQFS